MDWESTPQSVDEWLIVAKRYHGDARVLKKEKRYASSWNATGFAVECYLKAAIMRKEGLNGWPDRSSRPDLWQHDAGYLFKVLGITFEGLGKHPIRSKLITVLSWRRAHGYNPDALAEKYAEQIYQDAFSSNGVVEWIVKTYRLPC